MQEAGAIKVNIFHVAFLENTCRTRGGPRCLTAGDPSSGLKPHPSSVFSLQPSCPTSQSHFPKVGNMDDDGFVQSSRISVLAPDATELEIEELFKGHDSDLQSPGADPVRSIKQRALLYFGGSDAWDFPAMVLLIHRHRVDELLPIYLVLKTSQCDVDHVKSFFPRLSVLLELRATGSALRNSGDQNAAKGVAPVRQEDVIWKGSLVAAEDPVTIHLGDQEERQDGLIFVWEIKIVISRRLKVTNKLSLFILTSGLDRPRIRLQSPMINFKASAALQPEKHRIKEVLSDPYVNRGLPASENILEPLRELAGASGQAPSLSAARLRSIQPVSENPLLRNSPLKIDVPPAFRALPAISSRIRYQRPVQPSRDLSVIAHLDLETAPFSRSDVELIKVDVELPGGSAEDLSEVRIPTLPLRCSPRDKVVFLHRLTLNHFQNGPDTRVARPLDITVDAVVQVSQTCKPIIQMRWKTAVDFSSSLHPASGDAAHAMQQANKLTTQQAAESFNDRTGLPQLTQRQGQGETRRQGVSIDSLGVTMTFTAPSIVHVGEPFAWDVLIFNKSSDVQRLAIIPVPKYDVEYRGHLAENSSATMKSRERSGLADAVTDENILYAMQESSLSPPSGLVSLTSRVDVR